MSQEIFWKEKLIYEENSNYGRYEKNLSLDDMNDVSRYGAIAQLVEHLHGMQGVRGSNPLGSIEFK